MVLCVSWCTFALQLGVLASVHSNRLAFQPWSPSHLIVIFIAQQKTQFARPHSESRMRQEFNQAESKTARAVALSELTPLFIWQRERKYFGAK
jgi:hypothetical protein